MMKIPSYLVTLGLLCHSVTVTSSAPPGLTLEISRDGMDTAANFAIDELISDVVGKQIPDQHGDEHHLSYDITGTRVTSLTRPSSSLVNNPGHGVTWSLTGTGAAIHGDFHYKYRKGFIKVSDHGSFDASVDDVRLDVSILIGADVTGRPTISMGSCACSVGDAHVKFHGGASWIYNLFRHHVEGVIKDKIREQMCDSVKKAVDVNAAKLLSEMKVQVPIGQSLTLDYRLVSTPEFTTDFLKCEHKGEFFWTKAQTEAPFRPGPLPAPPGREKMVSMCLSDYVANTLGYVCHRHGLLNFTLTKNDLPKNESDYLNTTCTKGTCVGSFFPQFGKAYPNGSVEMAMVTSSAPTLNTTDGRIIGHVKGNITFSVRLPGGELKKGFTSLLEVGVPMTANVSGTKIVTRFEQIKFHVLSTESDVGPIPGFVQTYLFNFAAKQFILPQLNGLGSTGFELPALSHVMFVEPTLTMLKGATCFTANVDYDPRVTLSPHDTIQALPVYRHDEIHGGWVNI